MSAILNVQPITSALVDGYLTRDAILQALDAARIPTDEQLTCQRWLRESPAKRLIFESLYGDLLHGPRQKVLDIGGGLAFRVGGLQSQTQSRLKNWPWNWCR